MSTAKVMYNCLNTQGQKLVIALLKMLICNKQYRKADGDLTPAQFELCVGQTVKESEGAI